MSLDKRIDQTSVTVDKTRSKWSVKIEDIGPDQIVQHILPLQDIAENRKLKKSKKGVGKTFF